ncbi:MAG: RNA polymerase sigma factor [Steroidobacteraceae bacterium]
MSSRWNLKQVMQAPPELPQTPAAQALALNLVTAMDLLRLKSVARLYARGLPPEVGWADLLQEAFARVLDGSRKCPEGLPRVTFLAGVMRSIRTEYYRRARKRAARLPQILIELNLGDNPESEAGDPAPDPERSLIVMQLLAEIYRLFAEDPRALRVMEGLFEGLSPEQIRTSYDMSKTDYDSTRKRMRRALLREGLKWGGHDN